ncbi:hypothetical protein KLP40_05820 [Hymenobacter sp. NST-14]|uniref:DUF6896 domain-containing protein n=1 Tax=Hymenobacter piscis TaxID=2839984 RepID=UPI001C016569|nr:hypothetical protein [Hymenobacter piscis]MBT9392675.1 hypothetical protein [Hymenobacter piscis]
MFNQKLHPYSPSKMESEKKQLLGLIEDYKKAVEKAVNLLNAKSEREKGFQYARPENPESGRGYLDDSNENRYVFHGIGCLVTTKEFEVDFNFGDKRRCDGIDPWFVFVFLQSNKHIKDKYSLLLSETHVKNLLQELEAEGMVVKNVFPMSERTYYLTSDIQNTSPIRWKPYWPDDIVFED